MSRSAVPGDKLAPDPAKFLLPESLTRDLGLADAQATLESLADVFFPSDLSHQHKAILDIHRIDTESPRVEAIYRTLVEQIPAVVFIAFLDKGVGEAYVSPQIEELLGFSQAEWLDDPVRWYHQIHPDDKARWSTDAAKLFLSVNLYARSIASWLGTGTRCGFTVKQRWSGVVTCVPGLSTVWPSISPI